MLARYLRQQERPVRYAAQDALNNLRLAMAFRNLVRTTTRAHDLPHYADLAQGQLPHPAMRGLLQDIFGRHDPRAVGMLTDLHEETTGQQAPGPMDPLHADVNHPLRSLMDHMHLLRQMVAGQHGGLTHHEIADRYGQLHSLAGIFAGDDESEDVADRKYRLGQAVRETVDPHESGIYDLMRWVARTPHFDALRQGRTGALGGQPARLLDLYDALHHLTRASAGAGAYDPVSQESDRLRGGLAESMQHTLIPFLHGGLQ